MFQDIDGNKNLMAIFIVGIYNSLALALGYDLQHLNQGKALHVSRHSGMKRFTI